MIRFTVHICPKLHIWRQSSYLTALTWGYFCSTLYSIHTASSLSSSVKHLFHCTLMVSSHSYTNCQAERYIKQDRFISNISKEVLWEGVFGDKSGIFSYFSIKSYVVGIHKKCLPEYLQQMFMWRNKKNVSTFPRKKVLYLELWQWQTNGNHRQESDWLH